MKVSKIKNISHYKTNKDSYLIQNNIIENKTDDIFNDSSFDKRLKLSIKGKNPKLKNNALLHKKFNVQKKRIKKSIENNVIKLYKDDILKDKFIFYFIDTKKDVVELNISNKFKILATKYKLEECLNKINTQFNATNDVINIKKLKKDINKIIYNHKKNYLDTKNSKYNLEDKDKYLFNGLYNELSYYFDSQLSKKRSNTLTGMKINKILGNETIYKVLKNRILNKLTLYFILQGKLKYYGITNPTTTELNKIKSKEAIKKQLLTSLIIVGSKLKSIYDEDEKLDDIFSKKDFTTDTTEQLLRLTLGIYNTDENDYEKVKEVGENLFRAIIQLRHNLIHFKSFDIIDDKIPIKDKHLDINNIQKMLNMDIDKLNTTFINNIENLSIKEYLGENNKGYNFLNNIYLQPKYINFTQPSFTNIYKKGYNMYNFDKEDTDYSIYKEPSEDDKKNLGYKNFLQLVYKYDFLPNLKIENLKGSINSVLERNKTVNDSSNSEKFKYNQIDELWKNTSYENNIFEFFKEIQRQEMIKSSEKEETTDKKFKNSYTDFIRDVYAHYFNKYYNEKFKEFEEEKSISDVTFKNLDNYKNINNINLLLFYSLFKFLDNYEIGQIQAQLKKYYAINSDEIEKDSDRVRFLNDLNILIEIVKITKPIFNLCLDKKEKNQVSKSIETLNNYIKENITGFFEKDILNKDEYNKIYFQKENVIYHKGISDFILSGRNKLFLQIFKNYKITKQDLDKYLMYNEKYSEIDAKKLNKLKSNISYNIQGYNDKSVIEILQDKKEKLHITLTKSKNKSSNKDIKEYINLVEDIQAYNQIRNKITFIDLSKIAKIQYEILSRYIGFALDWERDIHFLLLGIDLKNKNQVSIDNVFDGGKVVGNLKNFPYYCRLFLQIIYYGNIYDTCKIRNDIAHMDLLRKPEHNILSYITKIQKLMSYDRKKRNAITKTIQEIFNRENIDIKYKINSKKVYDIKLESKKAQHLKNVKVENKINNLNIPIHSEEYIELLTHYLNYGMN